MTENVALDFENLIDTRSGGFLNLVTIHNPCGLVKNIFTYDLGVKRSITRQLST